MKRRSGVSGFSSGAIRRGSRVTVWREIAADVETPVSAFLKIRRPPYGFLYESVEGGERLGRYSFLGSGPACVYSGKGNSLEVVTGGKTKRLKGNPFDLLRRLHARVPPGPAGLPRFEGGLVGYTGYDTVRLFERLAHPPHDDLNLPDLFFMLQDTLLVFDRLRHTIKIIAHVTASSRGGNAYKEAWGKVQELEDRLASPAPFSVAFSLDGIRLPRYSVNMSRDKFIRNVRAAKEYIKKGDAIQVVLSQRFKVEWRDDPFVLYRSLRVLNPSPYMFFLELGEVTLVGSSPELLVRLEGDQVEVRPIAGTRPRGRTPEEDARMERELKADPKERAEHVMLVDLGRNDVGRVCRFGSVRVDDYMVVERYSHVMHLVSGVKGRLSPGKDAFDVLKGCFPAGTVTGAPKVRAMEIIDELEPVRRGPYAGAVGYVSFSGNMDTGLAIRTIVVTRGHAYLQAGMGIVADSVPESEYEESHAKARAGLAAIAAAQGGRPGCRSRR